MGMKMDVLPVEHCLSLTVEHSVSRTVEHTGSSTVVQCSFTTGLHSCLWMMVHSWVSTRLHSSWHSGSLKHLNSEKNKKLALAISDLSPCILSVLRSNLHQVTVLGYSWARQGRIHQDS